LAVVVVHRHGGAGHLADRHVADMDVGQSAAAHGVVLEADGGGQPGAVHAAILDKDLADAAADLAAQGHAAVAVHHHTAGDDDVLAGLVDAPAIGIAARFDGDAVVARIEDAV